MPRDHNGDWRILAEEARLEKDPDKLLAIVSALNRALDDREKDSREKTSGKNRHHPEQGQEVPLKHGAQTNPHKRVSVAK
jgi:hypothetical protein